MCVPKVQYYCVRVPLYFSLVGVIIGLSTLGVFVLAAAGSVVVALVLVVVFKGRQKHSNGNYYCYIHIIILLFLSNLRKWGFNCYKKWSIWHADHWINCYKNEAYGMLTTELTATRNEAYGMLTTEPAYEVISDWNISDNLLEWIYNWSHA